MAIKKFPHAVIYNGKFYAANAEIMVEDAKEKDAEIVVEDAKEKDAVKTTAKRAVTKDDKRTSQKA